MGLMWVLMVLKVLGGWLGLVEAGFTCQVVGKVYIWKPILETVR